MEKGILEKRRYEDHPPRFDYHLTEKGYDAANVLVAMMAFGEAWYFDDGREPIQLFDRSSGRRVRPVVVDAETGERLDARALYAGPGPSFPRAEKIRRERFSEYYARRPRVE